VLTGKWRTAKGMINWSVSFLRGWIVTIIDKKKEKHRLEEKGTQIYNEKGGKRAILSRSE